MKIKERNKAIKDKDIVQQSLLAYQGYYVRLHVQYTKLRRFKKRIDALIDDARKKNNRA